MGSFQIARPTIQPIEQPDVLQNYGRLLQLKGLQQQTQQQAAMAPIQQQEAGLQLQQQQQALRDQQAATAAMREWDGKSLDELAPLMLKKGASAQAILSLKQQALAQKEKYSQIAKDDAATGASNIATLKQKNDMVSGALSNVLQAPDEQLPQAVVTTAQQLAQQGLLDPQHVQMAQQIAQTGNPTQIRAQLDSMRKGMLSDSQLLDEAQKKAAIEAARTTQQKNEAEMQFYAQNGGAPGVSAELIQQSDWLKKNPGKGPSDYKLWMMKNSPAAMVMGNMFGPNDPGLDMAANQYRLSGQLPSLYRSPGSIKAIIDRSAQLDQQAGGSGIAANKAILGSYKGSLDQLQKNLSAVSAFEDTANKNINMLKSIAAKVPDLGVRFANTPIRAISGSVIGTENMAAFKTALAPVQAEAAKILNSANLTGQLSDTARKELQDIVDGNATYPALVASLNVLQQDFKNRHTSYQAAIDDLQSKIKSAGSATPQGSTPSQNAAPNAIGVGSIIIQGGHKFKVTAVDANGKPTSADPL